MTGVTGAQVSVRAYQQTRDGHIVHVSSYVRSNPEGTEDPSVASSNPLGPYANVLRRPSNR